MRFQRRGLAATVVAVIIVAIVLGAAGTYFFLVAPQANPGATSTTSSTTQAPTTTPTTTTTTAAPPTTTTTTATIRTSTAQTTSANTGTTTTTSTCTTSTTTSNSTYNPLNFTTMFTEFSEIGMHFNGTYNGNSVDETTDYQVVSTSSTGFVVNFTMSSGGNVLHYTDYVLYNGTASTVTYNNQNYTGAYAEDLFVSAASTYFLSNLFGEAGLLGELQGSGFVHSTGSANQTIGTTNVNVTTYEPNTLPLVEDQCGSTANFTKFTMSTGTVAGKSTLLLVSMEIAGSFSSQGVSEDLDVSLAVTSITPT